ncbi:hypothetical protein RI129_003963 [Pyrocoelia pectoralis]|uniref:39S ribosomal protein L13, mitochondrial n=1 Tax=Pyrocoelia pectoralis TaxID=417401 RepID=A0AAN7ZV94_9COLE
MAALKRVQQWATFARIWHVFDASWQNPFESAELLKKYLMGLHKPIYHPMNDCGDHVIVINSLDIALPGDEWKKRVYFHHTGYPGGATWTLAWDLHKKDPTLRRYTMERLHIFPDLNVPQSLMKNVSNQIRQIRPVPKRLDAYSEKEVKEFPKIIDLPKDYILR